MDPYLFGDMLLSLFICYQIHNTMVFYDEGISNSMLLIFLFLNNQEFYQ